MSNFQITLLAIFGIFIVIAVVFFSVAGGGNSQNIGGEVVLWGTIPDTKLRGLIDEFNLTHREEYTLKYEEKNPATYEGDLVEALASGTGPDLFLLPTELIARHADKAFPIPFDVLPERTFKDTFVEEGELYLQSDGTIALPFTIDPLVMYWNRDFFSSAGIARPPGYWDEFLTLVPSLTKRDATSNILRSGLALGGWDNITHAKDILATLIIQAGNPIIERGTDGALGVRIADSENNYNTRAESALRFYTEFANPAKPIYSWNSGLLHSRDMFLAEDLAVYFGYASELNDLIEKNPHLNFDVAPLPQIRDGTRRDTLGNMLALAISKQSTNKNTALAVAFQLIGTEFQRELAKALRLPPVRRDLLSVGQVDAYNSVFYQSALMSRSWLDPNPDATYTIFKDAVADITSGRSRIGEAVGNIGVEMRELVQ